MSNNFSKVFVNSMILVILATSGYFFLFKNNENSNSKSKEKSLFVSGVSIATTSDLVNGSESEEKYSDAKTFVFDNFHGSTNINGKFEFLYPTVWHSDGQYFSPQKIEYYDLYSVKAPFYFDLILSDIYEETEFKYQIDKSKRKSPDTVGKIDGKDFKRYDLIDYGSYGGESAGRVIVYVGPKINIDNKEYYLVFHWEEKPLTVSIPGNDPAIFEKVVQSLKFVK